MGPLLVSIGTIFGSIIFVLGEFRVLVPAICCLWISTTALTIFKKHKNAILAGLLAFLFVFLNYNLRAEHLEYLDIGKYLASKPVDSYKLKIVRRPDEDIFYRSEFVVEILDNNPDLKTKFRQTFLPYRFLAYSNQSQGLERGDVIKISNQDFAFEKLEGYKIRSHKKDKVYFEIAKADFEYVSHETSMFESLQKGVRNFYFDRLPVENAQIITSLLLGSRVSDIPRDFIVGVRNLGLGHFFAASGFHLLALTLFITWVLNIFGTPNRVLSVVNIFAIVTYAGMAGFSPSIVRAAIFLGAYFLLRLLDRNLKSIEFLLLIAGTTLLIDPFAINDIGFQFSYLATLAILAWAPKLKERTKELVPKMPDYLMDLITVTISVQLFLLPLVIYYFQSMQIWTVVANIVFAPFLSLLIVLAFMGLSFLVDPLLNLFKYLVSYCQGLPLMGAKIDLSIYSLFLVLLLINTLAYIYVTYKAPEYNSRKPLLSYCKQALFDSKVRLSLIGSIVIILFFSNLKPINFSVIEMNNGNLKLPKIAHELMPENNVSLMSIKNSKALLINDRSNIDELDDLQEAQLLILPNLNSKDIYLDTILEIVKPQFIMASVNRESKRAVENIKTLGSKAHLILNSGRLYVSDKYWSVQSSGG